MINRKGVINSNGEEKKAELKSYDGTKTPQA